MKKKLVMCYSDTYGCDCCTRGDIYTLIEKVFLLCRYLDIDIVRAPLRSGIISAAHKESPDFFVCMSPVLSLDMPKGMTDKTHLQKMFKDTAIVEVTLYLGDSDTTDFILWTKEKRDQYEKEGKNSSKHRLESFYLDKIAIGILNKLLGK
jgi:hypothetical protein